MARFRRFKHRTKKAYGFKKKGRGARAKKLVKKVLRRIGYRL